MDIVHIKNFSSEARDSIARLLQQLSPNLPDFTDTSFQAIIDSDHIDLFLLYADDGEAVGMLTLAVYFTPSGSKAWIEDVVVDNAYRGNGYGKALLLHAIDFIKKRGIKTVSLTSKPSRIAANSMYQTLGFSLYETNVYKMLINIDNA